ncbi:MAG TPA: putative porin [Pyrinomonadaceae bacterium]|nr:putative porin [Pyrinomonadaceae bacterium]
MPRLTVSRALLACAFCVGLGFSARAQSPRTGRPSLSPAPAASGDEASAAPDNAGLEEVRRALLEQQEEIKRMRALINEQSQVIGELRQRVEETARQAASISTSSSIPVSDTAPTQTPAPQENTDARLGRVEEQAKKTSEALSRQLGSITFSGDIRLRYEGFFGQENALPSGDNPAVFGNELSSRNRFRVRARLAIRGRIGKEFDWGLRLASGSFADAISTNQTLTDFYNRKPFGLDQAYIAWSPARVPGLRLQAGKFELLNQQSTEDRFYVQAGRLEVPWLRTEMTLDNDLQVEGFNQTYTYHLNAPRKDPKGPDPLRRNITFIAMELPFFERNSSFVRNANGTFSREESGRGGRDLALYAAQLHGVFDLSPKVALTLSASDLYFSGTQFISPIQVFGNLLQLPVTFTIPATATTPAQIITTQAVIPRDLLVAGNGNLGLSTASNNAVNRDGRLASGYNLVDLIARLDWTGSKKWPVVLLFNFVTNTQTHDVVAAGPGGANVFLKNNENSGYYAEIQVGRQRRARGDLQFSYTFMRLEKDAVLTPFNVSDVLQQSDMRNHRLSFSYTADPSVVLTLTGIVTERSNGLFGPFVATPAGSLDRPTTRIQFDTLFRF